MTTEQVERLAFEASQWAKVPANNPGNDQPSLVFARRFAFLMERSKQAERVTGNGQLIAQARAIHAKAMNRSDLAEEGAWVAHEEVIDPPLHNYWHVTATRSPTKAGVEPYTVSKAITRDPSIAGLLTFISTALPQLCDLADERALP